MKRWIVYITMFIAAGLTVYSLIETAHTIPEHLASALAAFCIGYTLGHHLDKVADWFDVEAKS